MIKLCRVDHRLIHGQVAFSWVKLLNVDCILIASDNLMKDQLRQNMMKLDKPESVKLVMKSIDDSVSAINSGVTDKYNLLVLFESVEDAYRLISNTDKIEELNLGGMKSAKDRITISKAVNVSQDDINHLNELSEKGVNIFAQLVPDSPKHEFVGLVEDK